MFDFVLLEQYTVRTAAEKQFGSQLRVERTSVIGVNGAILMTRVIPKVPNLDQTPFFLLLFCFRESSSLEALKSRLAV